MSLEARRARAFALLADGVASAEVARQLGVSPAAVSQWKRSIQQGGRAGLRAIPRPGRPTLLPKETLASLPRLLSAEALRYGISADLSTIPRIIRFVEQRWGVRYSQSAMSRVLRRYGVPRRRAVEASRRG